MLKVFSNIIVPRQRRCNFGGMSTALDSCFALPSGGSWYCSVASTERLSDCYLHNQQLWLTEDWLPGKDLRERSFDRHILIAETNESTTCVCEELHYQNALAALT
jgi:hypothetical protein